MPKIEAAEDEVEPTREVIKEAQALVAYGIGIMSRLIHSQDMSAHCPSTF